MNYLAKMACWGAFCNSLNCGDRHRNGGGGEIICLKVIEWFEEVG